MCPWHGELEEHGGGLGRGPERAGPEQGVEAESGVLAVAARGCDRGLQARGPVTRARWCRDVAAGPRDGKVGHGPVWGPCHGPGPVLGAPHARPHSDSGPVAVPCFPAAGRWFGSPPSRNGPEQQSWARGPGQAPLLPGPGQASGRACLQARRWNPASPRRGGGCSRVPSRLGGGRGAARSLAGVTFSRVSVLTTLCSSTDSAPSPPAKPPPPTVADLVDVCPRQPAPHARQPSWPGRELGSACGGLSGGRGVRVSRLTKPARPGPGSAPECGGAGSSDRCPLLWTCRGGSQRRCLSERGPPWPLGPSAPRQGGGSSAEGAVPGLKSEAVARPGDKPAPRAVPPGDKGVLGGRGQVRKGRRAVAGVASSSFLVVTTQCRSRRPRVRGP